MRLRSLLALTLAAGPALAAPPTGYLDAVNASMVGGWARDPDWPGPIAVHVYIDGEIAHGLVASALRPDLPFPDQDHGFTWTPPLQGTGSHSVVAYAIGVDAAGNPDGENPALVNSPGTIAAGCAGLAPPASWWCNDNPGYYPSRAADTEYLYDAVLRAGVNTSYGGTVFELYGPDHSRNLLAEHGGGAVQLSVWGYEPVGPPAWFAEGPGVCDPVPYPSQADCQAAGHASCRLWAHSQGAHVANCSWVTACGWGAGAPFNPIQAQGPACGWDSPINDVDSLVLGPRSVWTRHAGPFHFTQSNALSAMVMDQEASLGEAWLRLDYHLTYGGPWTLDPHPQEIPAVFPGDGIHASYSYYAGPSPWTDPLGPVTTVTTPANGWMLRLDGRGPYAHATWDDVATETWVSACDAAQQNCLTLAVFSPQYQEIDCGESPGPGYGYLTPLGGFGLVPGLDESFSAFLFPGRYDTVLAGLTVREWIHQLAATELPPPGDDDDATEDPGDDDDATEDPGDDDATEDPGDDDDATEDPGDDDSPADDDAGDDDASDGGQPTGPGACSCAQGAAAPAVLLLPLLLPARRRRPPRTA